MDLSFETLKEEKNTGKYSFWDFKGQYDFVDKWTLMGSPLQILIIISLYLLFVLKIGPDMMKNRKPFKLTILLAFYNAFQVLFSCFMFIVALRLTIREGLFQKQCMSNPETIDMVTKGSYYFLICKITELLDTIFFVLRKKKNQISFLHVYHHSLTVTVSWFILKYEPGFTGLFLGLINSFVHVVMYTYYGLSAYPSMAKFLWWKIYITKLQLVQFVLILLQISINEATSECKTSKQLVTIILSNLILFIYLFGKFYVDTYKKNKNIHEAKKGNRVTISYPKNNDSSRDSKQSTGNAKNDMNVKFSVSKKSINIVNGNHKS